MANPLIEALLCIVEENKIPMWIDLFIDWNEVK